MTERNRESRMIPLDHTLDVLKYYNGDRGRAAETLGLTTSGLATALTRGRTSPVVENAAKYWLKSNSITPDTTFLLVKLPEAHLEPVKKIIRAFGGTLSTLEF